jgi:hypothetical protein
MQSAKISVIDVKKLVIHSAIEANILPITSKCDA